MMAFSTCTVDHFTTIIMIAVSRGNNSVPAAAKKKEVIYNIATVIEYRVG